MQVTVQLRQASPRSVDYDHSYRLGSAIYAALGAFQPEAARAIHKRPGRAPYAVSEIYHHARKRGEAWFRLASPDEQLLRVLCGALMAAGRVEIGAASYQVRGVETAPVPLPEAGPVGVHTLSPVLIKDRQSPRSLLVDNCDYPTTLASVINFDIERMTGRSGTVAVINLTKTGVRKRAVGDRTVMAQKGTFWLDGDIRDVQHVLDYGIGHSTALGFGLVVPEV